ncbi:MAG: FtsX-like permease family protein [Candidatus Binatia bacterium]
MSRALVPLAVRHLATHARMAAVAGLAIACGVATLLATQVLHGSALATYEETTSRLTGNAALLISNADAGVGEEIADDVRGVPGVGAVAPSVEGFVGLPDFPGERLYLYGVDLLADQEVRDYGAGATAVVEDPLVFLAEPDSVALTNELAEALHVRTGDAIRVLAPQGVVTLTVRALLETQRGPASVLGGRLAVVDLSVAQDVLRMNDRVSQVAVTLVPDADVASVENAVRARVGGRGTVEPPRARTATFTRLLANYRYGLLLTAATATVVALFFVVNVATIAVVERRRELGLLRAIGVRPRHLAGLVAGEIGVLAAVASLLGLPLGIALAWILGDTFSTTTAALYGETGGVAIRVSIGGVMTSLALGIVTPLLAIVGPLRRVLVVTPLDALRTMADEESRGVPRFAALAGLGAVLVIGATGAWLARTRLPVSAEGLGLLAMLGSMTGVAACLPFFVRHTMLTGDRLASRGRSLWLTLAFRGIGNDLGSVAVTASALLVSVAGTIAVVTWIASLAAGLDTAFDTVFGPIDLFVSSGGDPFAVDAVRMPETVAGEIARIEGVADVDEVRIDRLAFEGSSIAIVASDGAHYLDRRRRLFMVEGDARAVANALAAGTGVVVNQTFASRFHRRIGDVIELATPSGPWPFRIAGIHLELTPGDLGTVRLDRAVYRRAWRDTNVNVIEVTLQPRADRDAVSTRIRHGVGERHALVVLTVEALREEYRGMLGNLTRLVYPLLALTVTSALVGMASARVAALMAQRRTFGLLRAVGATRRQLALLQSLEGVVIATLAVVMAAAVGGGIGWMQVEVLLRGMLGMSVVYAYPRGAAVFASVAVVVVTGAIGWLLGRRTGGMAINAALQAP